MKDSEKVYVFLRKLLFWGPHILILSLGLVFRDATKAVKVASVLLIPFTATAIIPVYMYARFPKAKKKALKLKYVARDLLEDHPYTAFGYLLFLNILLILIGWFKEV